MSLVDQCEADGCQRCGVKDPRVLEFHHRDRSTKIASPNLLARQGVKHSRLLEELAKCDVLCANCHRIVESEIATGTKSFPWQTKPRIVFEGSEAWIQQQAANVSFETALEDAKLREYWFERFLKAIKKENDCWFWRHKGPFIVNGRSFHPRVAAFAFKNGTLPTGHTTADCSHECVNPNHVRLRGKETERWKIINETEKTRQSTINDLLLNDAELQQHKVRFLEHVEIVDGHWMWRGGRIKGTPEFWLFGKAISARKFAIMMKHRASSRGKIRNTCKFVKDCVNPAHLSCSWLENSPNPVS